MIVTLLLICFFLLLVHHYTVRLGQKGRLIDRIPGRTTYPIIGNILNFCWSSPQQLWFFMTNTAKLYYPISRYWIFSMPNVVVMQPDDIEKILNSPKHNAKGFQYKLLHPWLGDGLLTSKGTKWQKRRKILTPAFHFSILKRFVEVLIQEGNRAVDSFDSTKETIIANVMQFTSHHTLNAISEIDITPGRIFLETSMGISLNDMGPLQQEYRQTIHDMGKILVNRYFKPWLLNDTIFHMTSLGKIQARYLNTLHSFTEKIIRERKNYHEKTGGQYLKNLENDTEAEDTEIAIIKKRMAMLDILIAESSNNGLTDLDIREEVDTFLFEGHDTVAIASCFSLLLLAEHKDIQDCARKEISKVMRENDGKLTMNALQNMSYLDRCLKEALRLYPSVFFISRVCSEDVKLQSYVIPEDTTVNILIYCLHHDPNIWPNPEVYDPDRFLPENIQKRHPYSYIPFSAGPRNCIGQRYAMLELKALVAPMIYNFYLEPVDYLKDVKFKLDIVLRTSNPLQMKLIPIKDK